MTPATAGAGVAAETTLPVRRIPAGERIYAIGDVHGRLDLLEQLVAAIRADTAARAPARVRIVLIGDIIDRGPRSAEIVRRCMALTARTDSLVVLKGNHEAMMVDALRGDFIALALWLRHGGQAALQSWGIADAVIAGGASPALIRAARDAVPADVLAWLDDLPLLHRIGDYLFVHAGIRPGRAIADQTADDLLWIRREFLESDADEGFTVVHGHSISEDGVAIRANRIGIDTGAYRTGILSALAIEGDRRWILATGPSAHQTRTGADRNSPADPLGDDLAAILGLDGPVPATRRRAGVGLIAGVAGALALIAGAAFVGTRETPPPRFAPRPTTTIAIAPPPPNVVPPPPALPESPPPAVVPEAAPARAATDRRQAERSPKRSLPRPIAPRPAAIARATPSPRSTSPARLATPRPPIIAAPPPVITLAPARAATEASSDPRTEATPAPASAAENDAIERERAAARRRERAAMDAIRLLRRQ